MAAAWCIIPVGRALCRRADATANSSAENPVMNAVVAAIALQSVLLLIFSTILDGGVLAGFYIRGLATFWITAIWMILRCKGKLNSWQIILIRSGWLGIVLLAVVIFGLGQGLWQYLGILPR